MLPGVQQQPDLSRDGARDDARKRGAAADASEVLLGLSVLHCSGGVQSQVLVWLDRRWLSVEFRARRAWLYPEFHFVEQVRSYYCRVCSNSDFMI
jgi:hypothetical protein